MGFKLGLAAGLTAGVVAGLAMSLKQERRGLTAERVSTIPTTYRTEPGSQADVDEIPTVWQSGAEASPATETSADAAARGEREDDA